MRSESIEQVKLYLMLLFVSVSSEELHVSPKSDERQTSMLRPGAEYEASGSTRDIHELQAALQAAQLTATGTGSKYSGTQRDSYLLYSFKPGPC